MPEVSTSAQSVMENLPHTEPVYMSTEFWVSVAFILAVCVIFVPVVNTVKNALLARIKRIKDELDAAENLKLDAQKLYADYERKFLNVDNEIAEIIKNEEALIEETKDRKMCALNAMLRQKTMEADARIELAEELVRKEINDKIKKQMTDIVKNVFLTKITPKEQQRLIDQSIKKIEELNI